MNTWVAVFVVGGTLISLVAFFLILHLNRTVGDNNKTTGHNYDGIEEYDNPLPSWWYWKFVITIIFAVAYLIYYPGLGNWDGIGKWTSVSEYEQDVTIAEAKYGPLFAKFGAMNIDEIANHPEANKMGRRLFANNCAICHGAGAKGSYGFPNLTDDEWIWGNSDDAILATLTNGRQAAMPAWGGLLGDQGVVEVSEYVLQMAGREVDEALADAGKVRFQTYCLACHGIDGKGNALFGAPDLTNEIWLYGNSRSRIQDIVKNGRNGRMPAFEAKLGADKVRIVAGYVKSLAAEDEGG